MSVARFDLLTILPHVILAAGTVIVLIAAAVFRRQAAVLSLAAITLACSLLSLGFVVPRLPAPWTDLFFFDGIAAFSTGLVLFASFCIIVLAHPYIKRQALPAGEFAVLLMLATLGGLVLVASSHAASLVLGVELIGIPLVVMAAYVRRRPAGIEAGFKYLVLSGVSSAILLFGIALLYAGSGSLLFGPAVAFADPEVRATSRGADPGRARLCALAPATHPESGKNAPRMLSIQNVHDLFYWT